MENGQACRETTRERILKATLDIIGNEGFHNVTIKKIAVLAGVNIAAVNYHFGSKDNVINEAMKVFTSRLISCFRLLEDKCTAPEERLKRFLQDYSDRALEYPDVLRIFVSHSINDFDLPFEYVEFLKNEGIEKIIDTLRDAGVDGDKGTLFMKVFQMISALEFPIVLGRQMKNFSCIDYDNKVVRDKYIEVLLKSLLCI